MAKFIAFDDGNTVINIEKITMICEVEGDTEAGTRIWLGEANDPTIVEEPFDEVVKAVRAASRKNAT